MNKTSKLDPCRVPPSLLPTSAVQAQNKAAWKTKRGFVWPCPRTRQELITHPKKPSESRIDTLREPWIENELTGGRGDEEPAVPEGPPPELTWRREFDTVPSNGKAIFGGLKVRIQLGRCSSTLCPRFPSAASPCPWLQRGERVLGILCKYRPPQRSKDRWTTSPLNRTM